MSLKVFADYRDKLKIERSTAGFRIIWTGGPKLFPPLINPEQVAETFLEAAMEGGRDAKVRTMAVINTAVSAS